jgi:nitroreductase
MLEDLIRKTRSCRRFHQDHAIEYDTLVGLVNLARLSPSGENLQPLKYILLNDPEKNALIFPYLFWAVHLKDWQGPNEGERPSGYIIVLGDTDITSNFGVDHGIASHSILLGAREKGLSGCMIGNLNRDRIREVLEIPERYKILLVNAIGKPRETIYIETIGSEDSTRYWRDADGGHHVPKRDLTEIILES